VEAWKAQELRARQDAKLQAKQARLSTRRAKLRGKGPAKAQGPFLRRRERIEASWVSIRATRALIWIFLDQTGRQETIGEYLGVLDL